jgi:hypothetical protein
MNKNPAHPLFHPKELEEHQVTDGNQHSDSRDWIYFTHLWVTFWWSIMQVLNKYMPKLFNNQYKFYHYQPFFSLYFLIFSLKIGLHIGMGIELSGRAWSPRFDLQHQNNKQLLARNGGACL